MSFDSLEFLIFLPLVVSLYWLSPPKYRWIILLVASYIFYLSWDVAMGSLILGITSVCYVAGRGIERASRQWVKRLWLVLTLVVSFGLLFFFKYFNFLAENVNSLLRLMGQSSDVVFLNVILPVGISFYTFQAISYVIDVYRGSAHSEHHFGYYALYVSFFPQLVAGPIERSQNLLPQLRAHHKISSDDLKAGLSLLISGFFRKVVVADFAGKFVASVYAHTGAVDGGAVAIGTILFSIQIYCDFAGYSEIAAGSARLMGIHLMKNFNRPYAASGFKDFWRRWHISLSTWFSDYIYIPLGGSRSGTKRLIFAILVVFLVSSLWHGAAWTFVCWGLLHALYFIIEILLQKQKAAIGQFLGGSRTAKIRSWLAKAGTFLLVSFAWIFFRAESLEQALHFIRQLFSPWHIADLLTGLNLQSVDVIQLILITLMLPSLRFLTEKSVPQGSLQPGVNALLMIKVYLIMAIALSWLIRLEANGVNAFIYFQF